VLQGGLLRSERGERPALIRSAGPFPPLVMTSPQNRIGTTAGRYGPEVMETLVPLWEASDRFCGKRLQALLPLLLESLERHGHLALDLEVREKLLTISSATIDRLLSNVRKTSPGNGWRRPPRARSAVQRRTPVRTFNGWGEVKEAGWLEIDLVAHCGKWMEGRFLWTLVATDIATGWSECLPLLSRDGASVMAAQRMLEELYGALRLFTNLYQPSFKLKETIREGAKLKRRHHPPRTPQERLLALSQLRDAHQIATALEELQRSSDPVALLETVRRCQASLASLSAGQENQEQRPRTGTVDPEQASKEQRSLNRFLSNLQLLRQESQPLPEPKQKRRYSPRRRTLFAEHQEQIEQWLESEANTHAAEILRRLMALAPGRYHEGQLRSMERRVKDKSDRPTSLSPDSRTTRHVGYAKSIHSCRGIEKVFGWIKAFGGLRQFKLRGQDKVSAVFGLHLIAYNLIRLGNLFLAQPSPQDQPVMEAA
jgi:hypothetical protein